MVSHRKKPKITSPVHGDGVGVVGMCSDLRIHELVAEISNHRIYGVCKPILSDNCLLNGGINSSSPTILNIGMRSDFRI